MKIISGSTHLRFNSRLNHACYANLHNYTYIFDTTPRPLASVYDHKLLSILNLPVDNEWWFWIDDDAFFTQFPRPLESIGPDFDRSMLIFPKSPINPLGGWTFLSSGNFFFRNCAQVHDFFQAALEADLAEVKRWWNESELGMFTNGDQDKIVWELFRNSSMFNSTQLVSYDVFNTRPYHFKQSPCEHFLVHFAVLQQTKAEALNAFQMKFNFRNDSLIPSEYSSSADLFRHFSIDANRRVQRWWNRFR
jgi:hypothetical protein